MRFFVFERSSPTDWQLSREVTLAGKNSPFTKCVQGGAEWQISEPDILASFGIADPQKHSLILDLRPNDKARALLGRVHLIAGLSSDSLTTLLLKLEICKDETTDSPAIAKESWSADLGVEGKVAYTILLMNGGLVDQKWRWESMTPRNVTLFPESVMQFLARRFQAPQQALEAAAPEPDAEYAQMLQDLDQMFGGDRRTSLPPPAMPQIPVEELNAVPQPKSLLSRESLQRFVQTLSLRERVSRIFLRGG